MSKTKTVPCEACNGAGVRVLKPHEIETLGAMPSKGWATSRRILASINNPARTTRRLAHTALANRLRDLRAVGLVERRMITPASGGREYEWRIA